MENSKHIEVLFIAGFGPIIQDHKSSRKLYTESLGISFDRWLQQETRAGHRVFQHVFQSADRPVRRDVADRSGRSVLSCAFAQCYPLRNCYRRLHRSRPDGCNDDGFSHFRGQQYVPLLPNYSFGRVRLGNLGFHHQGCGGLHRHSTRARFHGSVECTQFKRT